MGLEAITLYFQTSNSVREMIEACSEIYHLVGSKYVFSKEEEYWIDIELQNANALSIRITLCNPKESVLAALDQLLSLLFKFRNAVLHDPQNRTVYREYNKAVLNDLKNSYEIKRKVFESIYGKYTAAIGSDKFYEVHSNK